MNPRTIRSLPRIPNFQPDHAGTYECVATLNGHEAGGFVQVVSSGVDKLAAILRPSGMFANGHAPVKATEQAPVAKSKHSLRFLELNLSKVNHFYRILHGIDHGRDARFRFPRQGCDSSLSRGRRSQGPDTLGTHRATIASDGIRKTPRSLNDHIRYDLDSLTRLPVNN